MKSFTYYDAHFDIHYTIYYSEARQCIVAIERRVGFHTEEIDIHNMPAKLASEIQKRLCTTK